MIFRKTVTPNQVYQCLVLHFIDYSIIVHFIYVPKLLSLTIQNFSILQSDLSILSIPHDSYATYHSAFPCISHINLAMPVHAISRTCLPFQNVALWRHDNYKTRLLFPSHFTNPNSCNSVFILRFQDIQLPFIYKLHNRFLQSGTTKAASTCAKSLLHLSWESNI